MINDLAPLFGFTFIFSIMALIRLGITFLRAIFSNPPKQFEMGDKETIIYGLFMTYIITYLIYLI
jgi:hypothetical protein